MLVLEKQVTQREADSSGQQLAMWRLAAGQVLQARTNSKIMDFNTTHDMLPSIWFCVCATSNIVS